MREVLQAILEEGGFDVALALDGKEAIARLDEQASLFRGLVTETYLRSGLDGWQIARHARQLNPNIAVVYTSWTKMEDWTTNGVPNSIMVPKPFASAQIINAVSALLNTTKDIGPT